MSVAGSEPIRVTGLKEYRRGLRAAGGGLAREFNKSLKVVAVETADDAQELAQSRWIHKAAARSIKGGSSGNRAYLQFGSNRYPDAAGNEYGGGAHPKGNPTRGGGYTSQFRPWRGAGPSAGYAVHPTIRRRQAGPNRDLVERQITAFTAANGL